MRALVILFVGLALLAGCQSGTAPETTAEEDIGFAPSDTLVTAQAACAAEGGVLRAAPDQENVQFCVREPQDANARCTTSSDCEGVCLARSRTCSPVIPLRGCHEVIQSSGLISTQCID